LSAARPLFLPLLPHLLLLSRAGPLLDALWLVVVVAVGMERMSWGMRILARDGMR
jgi:hypothetical protein